MKKINYGTALVITIWAIAAIVWGCLFYQIFAMIFTMVSLSTILIGAACIVFLAAFPYLFTKAWNYIVDRKNETPNSR